MSADRVPFSYWRLISGLFVIGSIVLTVYFPATIMNFRLLDDNTNLYRAGTLSAARYFTEALDPRLQTISYRPLGLIELWIAYNFFHANANYYHFVQVLLHFANSLLVFGIVWRLTGRWRLALLGTLLFAGYPAASEAVFWISEQSPLGALFSLAGVFFWVLFLQSKHPRHYVATICALILGLLTRESVVIMPIALFLIDWACFHDWKHFSRFLRRYVPFAVILLTYLATEYSIQLHGLHVQVGGYSIGWHVLSNYLAYLSILILPGTSEPSLIGAVLIAFIGILILGITVKTTNRALILLVSMILLSLGPVVFFTLGITARYLYLTTIPWSILLAMSLEWVWGWSRLRGLRAGLLVAFACLLVVLGYGVDNSAVGFAEAIRQSRVPFRDIMLQHPAFLPNTRLYLIEPPNNPPMSEIAGMFFLRYGPVVSVSGTYEDGRPYTYGRLKAEPAQLREYAHAYIYYFDEANRPVQVEVEPKVNSQATPALPIEFQSSIRLESFEVSRSSLERGRPLVLFLYWRAVARVDKDYKVFVHIVDSNENIIVGEDAFPRAGKEKTSTWKAGQFTADAHVIAIPDDAPKGSGYHLEVGLYELETMQRLNAMDEKGQPTIDTVLITPFSIQ